MMIEWISKKQRATKRRRADELKLRRSIAEKLSRYEEPADDPIDDYTELLINGEKVRVAKEQITITDVLTGFSTKSP